MKVPADIPIEVLPYNKKWILSKWHKQIIFERETRLCKNIFFPILEPAQTEPDKG